VVGADVVVLAVHGVDAVDRVAIAAAALRPVIGLAASHPCPIGRGAGPLIHGSREVGAALGERGFAHGGGASGGELDRRRPTQVRLAVPVRDRGRPDLGGMVGADAVELGVRCEYGTRSLVATAAVLEPVVGITSRHRSEYGSEKVFTSPRKG